MPEDAVPERSPLASKKFIAYLISEITWKVIIALTLFLGKDVMLAREDLNGASFLWWFLFGIVLVAGFIEAGYIGGQAWLDKYVRVAKIASGNRPGAKSPVEEPPTSE